MAVWCRVVLFPLFCFIWGAIALHAADIDECRELLQRGDYDECLAETAAAIEKGVYGESWHLVKADAEFKLGKYTESYETVQKALERYSWSVRLRWGAMRAAPYVGEDEKVDTYVAEIAQLVQSSPWRYTDAENLVTLGRFIMEQGADAKAAQDAFFTRAKKNNPLHRAPVLALGELALEKKDFQLAAEIYGPALETHPEDADLMFGMAQAFAGSDQELSNEFLDKALLQNPNHDGAMLYHVDRLIDGEQYDAANEIVDRVLKVNSNHPEAHAYRSVIGLLEGNDEQWEKSRNAALNLWETNPNVDHIIGRKLSQKYRFELGATYQQQALEFDAAFLPAKKQLIQDLMRLGREEEGWKLAEEVHEKDPYDIGVYNLVTLKDELAKFVTLETDGFQVRMSANEAGVYGNRVLKLLTEVREELTKKYQQELPETILVEIFPRPADFEVRTFGMPGIVGFLGVCFGDVITANSPASQDANPVNLDSVLWHEFAHVITLNKTNNRMPRWLSEGISVYEERQRDPSWGERMNVGYRKMILEGELAPIGEISQMFLSPKSAVHVQFAYFQSSLVVEHIINEFGFDALLNILDDLAVGMSINESIERRTVPLAQLDEEFGKMALALAEEYGKGVDWEQPDLSDVLIAQDRKQAALDWIEENGSNYIGIKTLGKALLDAKDYDGAANVLEQAIALFPYESGSESAYLLLAEAYRLLERPKKEQGILRRLIEIDDDAAGAMLRLVEGGLADEDWQQVRKDAEKLLGVKPLIVQPHAAVAKACEELNQPQRAIEAIDALLELDPADRADLYFRRAIQLQKHGNLHAAKRNALEALEEAPRYREALSLLVRLNRELFQEESESFGAVHPNEKDTPQ